MPWLLRSVGIASDSRTLSATLDSLMLKPIGVPPSSLTGPLGTVRAQKKERNHRAAMPVLVQTATACLQTMVQGTYANAPKDMRAILIFRMVVKVCIYSKVNLVHAVLVITLRDNLNSNTS
jgi:hypothetical protein